MKLFFSLISNHEKGLMYFFKRGPLVDRATLSPKKENSIQTFHQLLGCHSTRQEFPSFFLDSIREEYFKESYL